jgi:hypothetical protein
MRPWCKKQNAAAPEANLKAKKPVKILNAPARQGRFLWGFIFFYRFVTAITSNSPKQTYMLVTR